MSKPVVLHEWEHVSIGAGAAGYGLTRQHADALLQVARASRFGGEDGETVLVDKGRRLQAQQVVGVISTPCATMEILPKIDGLDDGGTRRNLVHMLARVLDLRVSPGAIDDHDWQRDDLLEVLMRLFCDELAKVVRRGLPRRYIEHVDDLATLRGRLQVMRQFTVLATTPNKLACRYDELSSDTALNQIMKAAVAKLSRVARSSETQRRLAEVALVFADVTLPALGALPWSAVVLDRLNGSWAGLLGLARLLLGDRFQTTSLGDSKGFSLLFEMNKLFEEYVGRRLRHALSGSGLDVRLQGPRDHVLEDAEGVRRFATKPDIVVSEARRPVLVVDTKWKRLRALSDDPKRGVSQADVYQMLAYAQVYRCQRLMLLYPHHSGLGPTDGPLAVHKVRGQPNVELTVASIDLSDLASIAPRLRALVMAQPAV